MATLFCITGVIYAVGLVVPVSTQRAIDDIIAGRPNIELLGLIIAALAAIFIEAVASRWRQSLVVELATFLDRRISRRAFVYLLRMRIDRQEFRAGDTINRFQQATKIRDFVLNVIPQIVFDLGSGAVSLLMMFYYDRVIGSVFLLASPFAALLMRGRLATLYSMSEEFYNSIGDRQNVLSETVNAIGTVKAQASEGLRLRRRTAATETMLASLCRLTEIRATFLVTAQVVWPECRRCGSTRCARLCRSPRHRGCAAWRSRCPNERERAHALGRAASAALDRARGCPPSARRHV